MADLFRRKLRLAVAAGVDTNVVERFGHAVLFLVYDLHDGLVSFAESRSAIGACGGGEGHHDVRLDAMVAVIADCDVVLVHEVGPGAVRILQRRGVTPFQSPGLIDDAVSTFAAALTAAGRSRAPGVSQ